MAGKKKKLISLPEDTDGQKSCHISGNGGFLKVTSRSGERRMRGREAPLAPERQEERSLLATLSSHSE